MPRQEAAALLGVQEDAAPQDVQRAYLRAARRTHPDVLPQADEAGRRAAGAAFARLTLARDALLADRPAGRQPPGEWVPRPGDEDGPGFRRVPSRGLGGSLVVLALLAFLLIALVSAEQAYQGGPFDAPGTSTSAP
jgi:hypothetical protein